MLIVVPVMYSFEASINATSAISSTFPNLPRIILDINASLILSGKSH
jgi:hypothetical protein